MGRRVLWGVLCIAVAGIAVGCARNVPDGFNEYTVFDRLTLPTALAFQPDGRILVAEKRGVILAYDGAADDTPSTVADLRSNVFDGYDRGLLDIELAPDFATDPAIYALYTYDAPPGQVAPFWGAPNGQFDACPDPPGVNGDGCVVMGRLSRLPLVGGVWTGVEQVLIHDWCQQYPSHSIGSMVFGPDGELYVGGGDGASFTFTDYGQMGSPLNPCGDPPGGVGAALSPPTAQGGQLRSQDLRTPSDPTTLDGSIARIDPATGAAMPDNPNAGSPDPNIRRIIAYGFRNPFRFTVRPGTTELWIGDVGDGTWEEIDRSIGDDAVVDNFGWPCYEGPDRRPTIDQIDLNLCESLYAAGPNAVKGAHYNARHLAEITPGENCNREQGSSFSGLAFAPANHAYPSSYDNALFFADATRGCIWVMRAGANGLPDTDLMAPFVTPAGTPVQLMFGPEGDLWYVDHYGGRIVRIGYSTSNHPPAPVVTATPNSGDPPLTVAFDAGGSTDPDAGDVLSFAWDLDNDGMFDDGQGPTAGTTFTTDGLKVVRVRVTDMAGASAVGVTAVAVGDVGEPVPTIDTPPPGSSFAVGDPVPFSGMALDPAGQPLPESTLSWSADILHCPGACHRHSGVFALAGVAAGTMTMPDHEYPAAVELHLTVQAGGHTVTATRRIEYRATDLTLASTPAGVVLSAGPVTAPAPFTQAFATNGIITVSAPASATIGGSEYVFVGWSDGGARSHEVTVPAAAATLTATYAPAGWIFADAFDDGDSAGWTATGGTWTICPPFPGEPGFALCGTGSGSGGVFLADGPVLGDGLAEASVIPSDSGGKTGLIARATDPAHYYALRLDDTTDDRRLWRLVRRDGAATVSLANGQVPHLPSNVYRLRLAFAGDQITAELSSNGGQTYLPLAQVTDGTYPTGQLGLESRLRTNPFDNVSARGY